MASVLEDMEKTENDGDGGLLDTIDESEDMGRAWRPGEARDNGVTDPDGIEGVVVRRFEMESDPQYGAVKTIPGVIIRDSEGWDWQIRGYRSILADEITKNDPQPGDTFAVKYMGQPKGKRYHVYRSGIRKGVPGTIPPPHAEADSGNPPF